MALARTRRSEAGMNYWPGFVDALSTLILGIIFLLTVFVVVQFYLQQEVQGKDTALQRLNAQIAQLTDLLSLEKTGKADLENQLAELRATLSTAQSERDKYKGIAEGDGAGVAAAQGKVGALTKRAARPEDDFRAARSPRSRCSTSRSPRCAASSRPSRPRSTPPSRRTRSSRAASPISASGSTSRWRTRCRS